MDQIDSPVEFVAYLLALLFESSFWRRRPSNPKVIFGALVTVAAFGLFAGAILLEARSLRALLPVLGALIVLVLGFGAARWWLSTRPERPPMAETPALPPIVEHPPPVETPPPPSQSEILGRDRTAIWGEPAGRPAPAKPSASIGILPAQRGPLIWILLTGAAGAVLGFALAALTEPAFEWGGDALLWTLLCAPVIALALAPMAVLPGLVVGWVISGMFRRPSDRTTRLVQAMLTC